MEGNKNLYYITYCHIHSLFLTEEMQDIENCKEEVKQKRRKKNKNNKKEKEKRIKNKQEKREKEKEKREKEKR